MRTDGPGPASAAAGVVAFWRDAGPDRWFTKDKAFDDRFRSQCLALHEAAASGALESWLAEPESALALVLLLDQFPRNCFRGTARMFDPDLRVFFYLPFEHSEDPADQERAVALIAPLDEEQRRYAELHRDIIRRFGRFPHRNAVLGRETTPEEQRFLDEGGFAG